MLDNYIFDEETNKIVCLVDNADNGEEGIITGPGVNEVFMIKVLLEKCLIDNLTELEDILEEGICAIGRKKTNPRTENHLES